MLHLLSAAPAPTAPSTCSSTSPFTGDRCTRPEGHEHEHQAGALIWGPITGELLPPIPPPPATPALDRVLRLAAKVLPCAKANPTIAPLSRIAHELRGLRAYYAHDFETSAQIDAWLELYAGRP
jgi:hypothetical protein